MVRFKRRFGAVRPYYALWQRAVAKEASLLDLEVGGFDIVHHATFSAFWLPNGVARLNRPLVVGPVSGGTFTPFPLLPLLGIRGFVADSIRYGNALVAARLTRGTWKRAGVVIAQNDQMEAFARKHLAVRGDLMVQSHAVDPVVDDPKGDASRFPIVLFVGRLETWKGVLLAIDAFSRVPVSEARLVFVGEGRARNLIERRARDLGLSERVDLLGDVPRSRVLELMGSASCLLFPSFHDSAGFVVSESLSLGLPVVCLDHGGPGWLTRSWSGTPSEAVPPGRIEDTVVALAAAVSRFLSDPAPLPTRQIMGDTNLVDTLRIAYARVLEPTHG